MPQRPIIRATSILCLCSTLLGCFESKRALHYLGDAELTHYKHEATSIDFPDVHEPTPDEVRFTEEPRVLGDRSKDDIWDMPLVEALHLALTNNKIIRTSPFLARGSTLYASPNNVPSVYDPAIQETGVLFGGRGVEAALADFDAQFTNSLVWGRDERIANSPFFGNAPGSTLKQETAEFSTGIRKAFGYGGNFGVTHNWDYLGTNAAGVLFPSSYTGNVQAEYRQPLWAGSGTEYTRIAGPLNPNFGAITGVSQGVVIARINNDITLADFEANVTNLLKDVEDTYWDLYLSYRVYATAVAARNSALRSWMDEQAKLNVQGGSRLDETQARDNYYRTKADAERALGGAGSMVNNSVYAVEAQLRRLLGLPVNDGRIIRPADQPVTAELAADWHASLAEALTRRVELRRQKWNIKSLELQLQAARSLTNPRLDFVSAYRVNGFGDKLLSNGDNDGITAQGLDSAYETITQGDQTGWNLGFEMSMPIGFRSALAQVRNFELRLVKARQVLAVQEMEIAHELGHAFRALGAQYQITQTNYNRRQAAAERLKLFQTFRKFDRATLDLVLRAQASLADAEREYYNSLIEYSKAIADLHYRKGTLLEHNNVQLAESEWTADAYKLALRRAWARSHAFDNKCLDEEPDVFALPKFVPDVDLQGKTDWKTQESTPVDPDQMHVPAGPAPAVPPEPPAPNAADPFKPAPALPEEQGANRPQAFRLPNLNPADDSQPAGESGTRTGILPSGFERVSSENGPDARPPRFDRNGSAIPVPDDPRKGGSAAKPKGASLFNPAGLFGGDDE